MTSSLNSCATVAVNDLLRVAPERQLRVTRVLTAVFGAVQIAVGIAGQWVQSSIVSSVLGVAAFTTGIVLGVFFLGLFTRRVGQRAALAGLVVGLAGMTWIFFATPLAWTWYALAGSLLTVTGGLVASLAARDAPAL